MKILVKKDIKASANENGNVIKDYKAGEVYEIYEGLAKVFLREGWGIEHNDSKPVEENKELDIEDKSIDNLENKAIEELENKEFKKQNKKNK
jgi:hypothetical protein